VRHVWNIQRLGRGTEPGIQERRREDERRIRPPEE
jgi:hypothetical protein